MFVVCFGAQKTGSTLCFQLVSALLEARGHTQGDIPEGAVDKARAQHFAPGSWSDDPAWLSVLASHAADPRLFAVKFHGRCTAPLASLIDSGKVLAVVNTRDPRDTLLALRDAGRRKDRGAFSRIEGVGDALHRARKGCAVTGDWLRPAALVSDYEELAFQTPDFLRRVASYLRLAPPDRREAAELRRCASRATATRNVMRSQRFLHEWTVAQAAYYTKCLREELAALYAFHENAATETSYPALELPEPPETITERTFVVLGCPQGRTSLIAGSLHAAGVYMGELKTAQYEDRAFKISPAEALRDANLDARLLPEIQERNCSRRFWGWSLPNAIYYIQQVRHLLVNPVFLFVYRDEQAIARSSAKHEGKTWWLHRRRLLEVARNRTQRVRDFEASLNDGSEKASFRVEDVQRDIPAFLDQLAAVLEPMTFDREAVAAFVSRPCTQAPASSRTVRFCPRWPIKRYLPIDR